MEEKVGVGFRIHTEFYPRKHIHRKIGIIVPSTPITVSNE